ncbi:transglutaminase-like cysteine peptidase [Sphingopyxis sp. H050]|uniref:transglutaminase-like cysteine peptidase n=1 Tax=Sphingopyxis sp. H050 TaxID=1759072 RepID=UPI0012E354D9|nr:transglutaminase-like cysteine peptidase [Sphingopyxis sp. H050]
MNCLDGHPVKAPKFAGFRRMAFCLVARRHTATSPLSPNGVLYGETKKAVPITLRLWQNTERLHTASPGAGKGSLNLLVALSLLVTRPIRLGFIRLLAAAALAAPAATLAADAAPGDPSIVANRKSAAFLADDCRKAVRPALMERAIAARPAAAAFSALERTRNIQEGLEPGPADAAPATAPRAGDNRFAGGLGCRGFEPEIGRGNDLEFGTAAIPIERTSFDDSWDRVRRPASRRLMRAVLKKAQVGSDASEAELLARINLFVNHRIAYRSDDRIDGTNDSWSSASETLARGSGDCEDFAILKLQLLRSVGVQGERMKLMLLRDLALNADHALLLVRSGTAWVALDNMTDRVYDASPPSTARPILSFSEGRRWIHGYVEERPTLSIAAISRATSDKASNDGGLSRPRGTPVERRAEVDADRTSFARIGTDHGPAAISGKVLQISRPPFGTQR